MASDQSGHRRIGSIGIALAVTVAVIGTAAGWNVAAATLPGIAPPDGTPTLRAAQAPTQTTPGPVTAGVVEMELIDEQYAFGPDESLHLVYRLTGDLASLGLTPAPAVPETTIPETAPATTPPTTPAATTPPATIAPADVAAATPDPASAPPATTAAGSTETTTAPPTTVPAPPVIPLVVEVTNYPPLATTADIGDLIGGDVDRNAFGTEAIDGVQIADARPSIVIADDGTATLTLDVPTDVDNSIEERLKFDRAGLYPIRTELLAGGQASGQDGRTTGEILLVATHGTIVQRLPGPAEPPTAAPPINLTIVTAIAQAGADTTADDEEAKVAAFDDAVTMAATVASPVTLQIPPPIVAMEASTPEGSARLESSLSGDEFVAMTAVPLDVSSAVAADRSEEFARQLGLGEDLLTEAVPTAPSSRNVWIVTEPLSGAGAEELRDLGFRYLVMPEELYVETVDPRLPASDLFVETALPGGGTLPMIVVDPLSEQLTTDADDILERSTSIEWAVRTVTEMLVEQADDEPRLDRSRVLSTPDLLPPDARLLLGLESLLATTPSVEFVKASTLTGRTDVQSSSGEPVQVELPDTAGPSLTERVAILGATGLSAVSAGSMLPADDPRPAEWAAELESMMSTAVSDADVATATARIQSETDAIRDAVSAPDPFSFTLTGRSGDIELQLANTSPDPLKVILRASSPKLSFPESTEPVVGPPDANAGDHIFTLRPNEETAVIIPVRAKSNGTSPITVQLLTPAGELIDDPVTITATVTAFTGLGQVLTAGLVLVLLTWWITHWRSRRRAALSEVRDRHPSGAQ